MTRTGDSCTEHKWLILLLSIVVQASISLSGYSGFNMPPKFGDFEAQRHWMEITTNLPISEWYVNSTNNDLNYWGLDYPPLTAYHSFIVGKISEMIHPEWTALHTSRGITNDYHKLFMRMSVMVTFVALYIPALWLLLKNAKSEVLLAALLYPGLMLIDNGHFQYNHISLGLFLWAVYFFFKNKPAYGSVAFVLALSFKQMELYHAIPIFAYLLGRSLFYGPLTLRPIKSIIYHLAKLGICVIITFAVVWAPFVYSKDGPLQVLGRIFPFYRGLFEDKVANFWCCSSVVFKFKDLLTIHQLLRASTGLVLLSVIPTFFTLLLNPSKTCFLMGLLNSSLSFFLFSFQVHEKSILLAAIPALLLLQEERLLMTTLLSVTNISLFPLLLKDGVVSALPYSIAYHCVFQNNVSIKSLLSNFSFAAGCLLCVAEMIVPPPAHLPFLFPLLNAIYSFAHFILLKLYLDYKMTSSLVNIFRGTNTKKDRTEQLSRKAKTEMEKRNAKTKDGESTGIRQRTRR